MSSLVAFLGHARRSQAVSAMHAVCVYANIGGGGGAGQIFEGAFRDFLSTKKIDTRKPFSNPPSKTPPKKHHTNFSDSVRIVYIPYWSWKVSIIPNTHHPSRIWAI